MIVAPGQVQVFALPPAFVRPQDGQAKQDCELNAATRWLQQWGARIAPWHTTLLGDDLYCHQPFSEQVLAPDCAFLFVCLPPSHTLLYEWVADFERIGAVPTLVKTRWTGKQRLTETYRWLNELPLRNGDDALKVGWLRADDHRCRGQRALPQRLGQFGAGHPRERRRARRRGRSRWKIENENNNTLKTKGYNFEHNYSHGKQHLSSLLASLMLLAFLTHSVLDLLDQRYRTIRRHLPSRRTFFEHLRALTLYMPFTSGDHLFDFMLEALQPARSPPKCRSPGQRRQI